MSDIRLLDLYRTSVLSSPEVLQILSLLYRDGPRTEEEISKALELPMERVKTKIRPLFQSSFVELIGDDKIAVTERASLLLSRLGITEIAAKSFVSDPDVPELHNTFLQACIEARSSVDKVLARQFLHLLKSFDITEERFGKSLNNWDKLKSRLLFIFVVGMDPSSHQLGESQYCHSVMRWHSSNGSDLWQTQGEKLLKYEKKLAGQCRLALRDADISFKTLIRDDSAARPEPSELTLMVTLARVLSALLYKEPDPGLASAFWSNQRLPQQVWGDLEQLTPRVEAQLFDALQLWGYEYETLVEGRESKKEALSRKLWEILRGRTSPETARGESPTIFLASPPRAHSIAHPKLKNLSRQALNHLRRLQEQLSSEEFDSLPLEERVLIIAEVENLTQTTRDKLIPHESKKRKASSKGQKRKGL